MTGPATAEVSVDEKFWEIVDANFARVDPAIVVSELGSDIETRQRVASFIGSKISDYVEVVPAESNEEVSLMSAIKEAKNGDPQAVAMVKMNIKTDMVERTIKSGHIIEVPLEINADGQILQFGQTYQAIQANSLRALNYMKNCRKISPQSAEAYENRVKAETLNSFRIEELRRSGLLENYSVVVVSLFPDDIETEDASRIGFFTDSMSASIQRTGLNKHGDLVVESAFVSGKSRSGKRHDKNGVNGIVSALNIESFPKTSTEILSEPILVPNELIRNGVVDIVGMYDRGVGEDIFFGTTEPKKDYLNFRDACKLREAEYEPNVDMVFKDLLDLSGQIKTEAEACSLLNKLSAKYSLMQAVANNAIDASVFGQEAEADILKARIALANGDYTQMAILSRNALAKDKSSSCPGGIEGSDDVALSDYYSSKNNDKDCEFVSKSCPMCGKKNVKTVVTSTHVKGACGCIKAK